MASALTLSGLSSGLDTDAVISQLMTIERRPVTIMQQRIAATEARQTALRTVNTKLAALQTAAQALMSTDGGGPFQAATATSSDATAFTVTARGSKVAGSFPIDVEALASAQRAGGGAFDAAHAAGTLRLANAAGGVDVQIDAGDDAKAIAAKINAQTGSPLGAAVLGGALVLVGKRSGAAEQATMTASGGLTLASLGLDPQAGDAAAGDARLKVAGQTVTSATNTFTDLLPGVDVTAVKPAAGQTLAIAPDPEAAFKKLQDLVVKYNDVVTQVQVSTRYDAAKKSAGVLNGDSVVGGLLGRMHRMVSDAFDATPGGNNGFGNAATVGLTMSREGTLTLDETKLRAALKKDPAAVQKLFTHEDEAVSASNPDVRLNQPGDGIANRLAALADTLIDPASKWNGFTGTARTRGDLLTRIDFATSSIADIEARIGKYEERLTMRETTMRQRFAAMEKAVSSAKSQAGYLTAQLGATGA